MRKKCIALTAALLLIFSLLSTTAFAESAAVVGNAVNLRAGPGTGYQVLDTLTGGTVVEVTGYSGSWAAVSYNGVSGYMASGYLSPLSSAYQSASVDVAGSAAADEGSAVIILDGASSGSASSGTATVTLPPAADSGAATVTLPPAADSGAATVTLPPSSGSAAASSDEGSAVIVLANGSTVGSSAGGSTAAASNAAAASNVGRSGTINMDFVCLRSGPGSNYGIISTYNKGKELLITGEPSGSWTPCSIDNRSGYVYTQYITLRPQQSTAAAVQTPQTAQTAATGSTGTAANSTTVTTVSTSSSSGTPGYITGNNVRLRSGPSMSSGILRELFYGNSVSITGTSGDWTAVICNGQAGYVYSQYVKRGSTQQSTQTTAQSGGTQTAVTTPAVSGGSATGQQIASYALQFVGYPYKWGGMSPETGFDCSGFVKYVYSQFGYTLNRVAGDQASSGVHVDNNALQPGDILCFYSSANYIGHTGIYVGNNKFVHASTSTTGVILSELSGYYTDRGFVARRII